MSDLNALLRWAVENSTSTQPENQQASSGDGMTLKFKPAAPGQEASKLAAALHPSDAQYPIADLSPASTPGPGTPATDAGDLPPVAPARRSDLTSEMLDLILGKPDSATMKEKMATATDESQSLEDRVEALDDFEMLIEMIDNANNMPILKLWEPLLGLLKSSHPEIVRHALWIVGTAAQNNLKGQAALFIKDALPMILNLIYPTDSTAALPSTATRAKAVYALSSAIKHWPLASSELSENSDLGYSVLKRGVADKEKIIRRKIAFLVGTLVMQSQETYDYGRDGMPSEVRNLLEDHAKAHGAVQEDLLTGLKRSGVLSSTVAELVAAQGEDVEYDENVIRALSRATEAGGLSAEEKKAVKGVWNQWGAAGQAERGLEGAEAQQISKSFD